jgi:hypothetical protein
MVCRLCGSSPLIQQAAEEKGGVRQVLADHCARVYKVQLSLAA